MEQSNLTTLHISDTPRWSVVGRIHIPFVFRFRPRDNPYWIGLAVSAILIHVHYYAQPQVFFRLLNQGPAGEIHRKDRIRHRNI